MWQLELDDGEVDLAVGVGLRGNGRREDWDTGAVRDENERMDFAALVSLLTTQMTCDGS